jgi:hypothetical protein
MREVARSQIRAAANPTECCGEITCDAAPRGLGGPRYFSF